MRQPQTSVVLDRDSFERLKKTIKHMSVTHKQVHLNPTYSTNLPVEVGLKLTNGCNLRCKHCFEWNAEGYHRDLGRAEQREELDFAVIEKVFRQTKETNANMFLWGGEPLYYSRFNELADLLEQDPRWTVLCTNGIQIIEKLDSILKMSKSLVCLISLEGFEAENDAIRGKGTFKKVMAGIDKLLELEKEGIYQGKISIHLTISDVMIDKLYDFVEFFEQKGIDSVYITFPWYLPDEVSNNMDRYFNEHFKWLADDLEEGHRNSWHSFKYRISPDRIDSLLEQMERINQRTWNLRTRYQPALELHEVRDFVLGSEKPAQNKTQCLSIRTRLDVLADGEVSACKLFPEFSLGNLADQDLKEIWDGDNFERVRETLQCGLMPVCSKCILLYLHGK
ncbi:radical SAM protein [Paenibacillus silagei]|uniref:MoaA/NifB/PqqE/SkfB family radical SAM enzyme n=1 Tax=Paenibacillus silagei TaxID=1670801 RepID=A0ABS4NSC9_9BACL|nr:radical SAM protein [Paenibacillus silagei]MBP2112946.1 MoaA/NifB/PqqE/SkfB family radical SAM enzyme [Paenibacillus silagei]